MVGRDGAAHVSKPARILPGVSGVGAGDGLLASTGPVGFGVGLGVDLGAGLGLALRAGLGVALRAGLGVALGADLGVDLGVELGVDLGVGLEPDGEDAGALGGVSQDAPGPVSASALGQAEFLAMTCPAARTMTACPVLRIESPARSRPARVVAARVVAARGAAAGRTVASICSVAPGPVPYVAPIDGALSGIASASSCRSGSWTIVPGLSASWPPWRGPLLFPAVFGPADAAGA
jgi:hypothetical protein